MKPFKLANEFSRDEEASVTVDWVVLTTAVVSLGIAILGTVASGSKDLTADGSQDLVARTVIYY
ncbi:hypothetical protein [Celeribacter sp. ULVN23_4]